MTLTFIIHTILALTVILILVREFINTPVNLKIERRFERVQEVASESEKKQWKTLNRR